MKRLAVILTLCSTSAFAHYPSPTGLHPSAYHGGGGWIVPALIGGAVVGAILSTSRPAQPPIVVQPLPYPAPGMPPLPSPYPMGYRYELLYDPACTCYRTVLIPN